MGSPFDSCAFLDRDVLIARDKDNLPRNDAGLDLRRLLAHERDIACSGDIVVHLDRLAGACRLERNIASSRRKRLVCVHIACSININRVGGNCGGVLEIALICNVRLNGEIIINIQFIIDFDNLGSINREFFGEVAHQIDPASLRGAKIEGDRTATDGVDYDSITSANDDIAAELEVVSIDGAIDRDILAEEERIIQNLTALNCDVADRRANIYGRRRVGNHVTCVVDTCGDSAE